MEQACHTYEPLSRPVERIAALEAEIVECCGHLNAATYRWLTLLAEFDVVRGWAGAGTRSCAHWLNWKCGVELGAAREKLRVAHALRGLPRIAGAMASGELSYSKARAMTRVATPATEALLLNVARHGTAAHVERLVRAFRRVREVENVARDERQHRARGVHWHVDEDGSYVFRLTLPAEAGARFVKALDAAVEALPAPKVTAEVSVAGGPAFRVPEKAPWSVKRADALGLMVESFLAQGAAEQAGHERTTLVVQVEAEAYASHRREQAATPSSAGAAGQDRGAAMTNAGPALDVSAETFCPDVQGSAMNVSAETSADPDGALETDIDGFAACHVEHGAALPLETARRLGCDASVIRLVVDTKGEPLDVGRRTRTIPPTLRRALAARDQGCRYPGCTATRYVDGHHVQHWAAGGETKLANLVLLCRYHHRLVHEGGASVVVLDDGALRFTAPDGRVLTQDTRTWRSAAPDVSAETSVRVHPAPGHEACGCPASSLTPSPSPSPSPSSTLGTEHVSAETSTLRIVTENRACGLSIDAHTAATRWCGERMDYALAVDGLLWAAARELERAPA